MSVTQFPNRPSEKDVPCVRPGHLEWFAKMSGREQIAYIVYSLRYGIDCDHMGEKARAICLRDVDRFIADVLHDQRCMDQKRRELSDLAQDAIGTHTVQSENSPTTPGDRT